MVLEVLATQRFRFPSPIQESWTSAVLTRFLNVCNASLELLPEDGIFRWCGWGKLCISYVEAWMFMDVFGNLSSCYCTLLHWPCLGELESLSRWVKSWVWWGSWSFGAWSWNGASTAMLYYFYWKKESPGGGDLSGGDAIPSTMLFLICLLAWAGLEVWRAGWVWGVGHMVEEAFDVWWRSCRQGCNMAVYCGGCIDVSVQ